MKIALISFSDNYDHQDAIFSLYKSLISNINDCYLFLCKEPKITLNNDSNIFQNKCPKKPGFCLQTFNIFAFNSVYKKIKKLNIDCIYFESLHVWNYLLIKLLNRKVTIIHSIHDVIPHDKGLKGFYIKMLTKSVSKSSHLVFVRSKQLIPTFNSLFCLPNTKVEYLPLCRTIKSYVPHIKNNRFLFFGRMTTYKGLDNIIQIISLLPDVCFNVVGRFDKNEIDKYNKINSYKNANVVNCYVNKEEMNSYLNNCDFVLLPYHSASQSGVLIDANLHSRPTIAFNVGSISEQIIDNKTGFLIDGNDVLKMVDKIKQVCSYSQDEYDKLCISAYEFGSSQFNPAKTSEIFINALEKILK